MHPQVTFSTSRARLCPLTPGSPTSTLDPANLHGLSWADGLLSTYHFYVCPRCKNHKTLSQQCGGSWILLLLLLGLCEYGTHLVGSLYQGGLHLRMLKDWWLNQLYGRLVPLPPNYGHWVVHLHPHYVYGLGEKRLMDGNLKKKPGSSEFTIKIGWMEGTMAASLQSN